METEYHQFLWGLKEVLTAMHNEAESGEGSNCPDTITAVFQVVENLEERAGDPRQLLMLMGETREL